ncbi:solute carrier family 22 member 5-like protein [Dinothrombium tinctorium]|uniref:Solute carrier family 22 member 5-like protein n=1 Tax=Dinothrombium tinctorium TaxID=1965070 RepID=A0A3S3NYP0_9ACAR|nr:solute carrier family 22 member 5-like protein [Dinothrombium tinctorium]RWS08495.1 solute carrier family 22 member 5-like protein [Dinothrombium tinctorium]
MEFEKLLNRVGSFGRYQKRLLWLFFLPTATISPWLCTTTLFMVSAPNHYCLVASQLNISARDYSSLPFESDSCTPKEESSNASAKQTAVCEYWIYDTSNYDETAVTQKVESEEEMQPRRMKEFLFNSKLRIICVLITIACVANEVAYTGLQLNVTNFHGNEFVNFFLFSIIEIPSFIIGWFLMESRFGRRWSISICLLFAGISLALCACVPSNHIILTTTLATIGKLFVTASYMIISLQAAELYPTKIRNQGLSISATCVSVIAIFLPFLIYFGKYGKWIPLVIMSSFCTFAGIVSSFLPETRNEKLIESVEQIQLFQSQQQFWSLAKERKNQDNEATEGSEQTFHKIRKLSDKRASLVSIRLNIHSN